MAVRHFRLTFTTQGPVHIGDGQRYGKKDYFSGKNVIAILDVPAFILKLSPTQLEQYQNFLSSTDSRTGLQDFLDRQNLLQTARSCVLYEFNGQLNKSRRGEYQYFDVATFVKDPYGHPYVPGSSIKGMLRTALLLRVLAHDNSRFLEFYDENLARSSDRNVSKKADSKIEQAAFWKEEYEDSGMKKMHDIMRYVSVSDSSPLPKASLAFVKKFDKFSRLDDGSHKMRMGKISDRHYYEGNELNIYRECIKPETTFDVQLDIDDRVDQFLSPDMSLDAEALTTILHEAYELYDECFLSHFDIENAQEQITDDGRCRYAYQEGPLAGMRCKNSSINGTGYCGKHQQFASSVGPDDNEETCYIGGGVGFTSKTIFNALFANPGTRVDEIAHVLYSQFPSKVDHEMRSKLVSEIKNAGFNPKYKRAEYKQGGRLKKAKDDHRHWRDPEFEVSPHTLKLGIIGNEMYQMGKCTVKIGQMS